MRGGNYLRAAIRFLPLVLFGAAAYLVHQEISRHNLAEILGTLRTIPVFVLFSAVLMTVVNYAALAGYDIVALRYTDHKIPLPKIVLTSLIGYAISNNTGYAPLAGGSVRYRFYNAWGIPGWDIAKISAFLGFTFLVGTVTAGFAGILLMPGDMKGRIENPEALFWMQAGCVLFLSLYWGAVLFYKKPVKFKNLVFTLPSPGIALAQTLVSVFDIVLASVVLWILIAGRASIPFENFLVIYVIAQLAGVFSQVPGGIGVFEGSFLWLAGPAVQGAHLELVGALILYRIIYYFLPLGIAGISLLIYESLPQRRELALAGRYAARALSGIVPQIFSMLLMVSGGILLISGATPSVPENMHWLRAAFPLPVIEASHLLGSIVGTLLLFLAHGIRQRIDAAWFGSLLLLTLGIIVSLLKGFEWREAAILAAMLFLMLPTRRYFRRRSSLMTMPFTPGWVMLVTAMLAGTLWIGFFSYRHIEYASDLWWQFSYKGDAPRFLRASVIIVSAVTLYALWRLTAVARPAPPPPPDTAELDEAQALIAAGSDTQGFLALCGDKRLLWSPARKSFIMYAETPRYWIAMGDPVGESGEFGDLLWRFRELSDKAGAGAVFYQVSDEWLPLYLDIGLVLLKMGEEARLSLKNFSLEGKKRADSRTGRNKLTRLEYRFSILGREETAAEMARLREVSDLWLAHKKTHEKSFSLGYFKESYIARTRVAVARDPTGKIMAFASLWELANRQVISIDLMRYDPQSPGGIMDFLFAELMLWGKAQGFAWFSLGMAPLAGLERRPLAPLWHKIGTAVYDLGEEFYNFEGLYEYKAKFEPELWKPRYIVVPPGLNAPAVLLRTASLISGGWKGLISR